MNQDKKELILKVEAAIQSCFTEYEISASDSEKIHKASKDITKSILKATKKAIEKGQKKEEEKFKKLKKKAKAAKVEAWVAPLED